MEEGDILIFKVIKFSVIRWLGFFFFSILVYKLNLRKKPRQTCICSLELL